MRKKVGSEDGVLHGARREREESMHRKAAALAWFKHGRKGSSFLGSARGGAISKTQNPLLYTPTARRHEANATSSDGASESIGENDEESITMSMCANMVPPCIDSAYHTLPYTHQASRFKAEALALQNSSSSSSASPSTTSSNYKQQLINMTTGQSLALLSLLPHHQSQKCFKKGYGGTSSNGDNLNTAATPWDCGSSLYDSFELLSLSNQLGRCLTTVNAAAATVSPSASSSSYSKLLKNLASNPMQGPSLQPSYIPRSLYSLPQFMIPNYLVTKSSKKRSSLIHPIFSTPNAANATSTPCLPAPPPSSSPLHSQSTKSPSVAEDHAPRKRTEGSGFRRILNSVLKSLHMKEDPANQKPKRSNLSEELEKLPKNRPPSSRGALKYEDPGSAMALNRSPNSYSSSSSAEMASKRSPTSSPSSSSAPAVESRRSSSSSSSAASTATMTSRRPTSAASYQYHHHFRNEGFRTTSKPPKSVKWVQPGAS